MKVVKVVFLILIYKMLAFGVAFASDAAEYDVRISYTGDKKSPTIIRTQYCKGTTMKCGTQIKKAPNGVVIFRASYDKDKYEGKVSSYYLEGTIKEERYYNEGKEEGKRTLYFPNGKMQSEQEYKFNKREGEGKKYYESGVLQESFTYENNEREGIRAEFDKNGMLQYETLYKKGKKQWMKHYDEKGTMIEEKNCRWQTCY